MERIELKHSEGLYNSLSSISKEVGAAGYLLGLIADVRDCISDNLYQHLGLDDEKAAFQEAEISNYLRDAALNLSLLVGDAICSKVGLESKEENEK